MHLKILNQSQTLSLFEHQNPHVGPDGTGAVLLLTLRPLPPLAARLPSPRDAMPQLALNARSRVDRLRESL